MSKRKKSKEFNFDKEQSPETDQTSSRASLKNFGVSRPGRDTQAAAKPADLWDLSGGEAATEKADIVSGSESSLSAESARTEISQTELFENAHGDEADVAQIEGSVLPAASPLEHSSHATETVEKKSTSESYWSAPPQWQEPPVLEQAAPPKSKKKGKRQSVLQQVTGQAVPSPQQPAAESRPNIEFEETSQNNRTVMFEKPNVEALQAAYAEAKSAEREATKPTPSPNTASGEQPVSTTAEDSQPVTRWLPPPRKDTQSNALPVQKPEEFLSKGSPAPPAQSNQVPQVEAQRSPLSEPSPPPPFEAQQFVQMEPQQVPVEPQHLEQVEPPQVPLETPQLEPSEPPQAQSLEPQLALETTIDSAKKATFTEEAFLAESESQAVQNTDEYESPDPSFYETVAPLVPPSQAVFNAHHQENAQIERRTNEDSINRQDDLNFQFQQPSQAFDSIPDRSYETSQQQFAASHSEFIDNPQQLEFTIASPPQPPSSDLASGPVLPAFTPTPQSSSFAIEQEPAKAASEFTTDESSSKPQRRTIVQEFDISKLVKATERKTVEVKKLELEPEPQFDSAMHYFTGAAERMTYTAELRFRASYTPPEKKEVAPPPEAGWNRGDDDTSSGSNNNTFGFKFLNDFVPPRQDLPAPQPRSGFNMLDLIDEGYRTVQPNPTFSQTRGPGKVEVAVDWVNSGGKLPPSSREGLAGGFGGATKAPVNQYKKNWLKNK